MIHEFADRVARAVGAPAPREVRVDCQVSASASFCGLPRSAESRGAASTVVCQFAVRSVHQAVSHPEAEFAPRGHKQRWFLNTLSTRQDDPSTKEHAP
jgi:hypothetical protein